MATRKLTVTSCELVKTGETNGREWTLYAVRATNEAGDVVHDLNAFEELEVGVEKEYVVKKREKVGRFKTFVSYTLSLPKSDRVDSPKEQIPLLPRGRYAVTDGDSVVMVRVWRGSQNPMKQRMYAIKGVKDEGQRLDYATALRIAKLIAPDPHAAAREFGRRTGHCHRCEAKLEKNLSRKLAIGPECLKHVCDGVDAEHGRDKRLALLAQARKDLRALGIDPEAKYDDLAMA